MITAQADLRQSILDRASGYRESCFANFRTADFQVLQLVLDVAFCGVARVSEVRAKASAAGIKTKAVISALNKLHAAEMVHPCVDPHTGVECVQTMNFSGTSPYRDINEMASLE